MPSPLTAFAERSEGSTQSQEPRGMLDFCSGGDGGACCCFLQGMKKRVGFQFNALEDTVESIGLEMVEQLALNPHQVSAAQYSIWL